MKKWISQDKRRAAAERSWLDKYVPRGKVSGEYLVPIPDSVYEPAGGFKKIGNQLLKDE